MKGTVRHAFARLAFGRLAFARLNGARVTRASHFALAGCLVLGAASVSLASGCKKSTANNGAVADDASVTPPFALTEASEGLLLTWIDEKGDFHVEQKVSDVPLVGRDSVRVLDPSHEEGTHDDKVFVADLRTARPDGTFAVHTMTRAEFDALAITRRAKNAPTLADTPAPNAQKNGMAANTGGNDPSGNSGGGDPGADPSGGSPATRPAVIIYGASWCGACHDAAAYLKRKGIPFIEKDIETDAKASQEMRSKLTRAGLRGGSIPVLDVRGRVMVGFNPREVDNALGQAL